MAEKKGLFSNITKEKVKGILFGEAGIGLAAIGIIEIAKNIPFALVSWGSFFAVGAVAMGIRFLQYGYESYKHKH